jgi:hypothetical protein
MASDACYWGRRGVEASIFTPLASYSARVMNQTDRMRENESK